MKTGIKKVNKVTTITFDEASPIILVQTYNAVLKKKLSSFARECPESCVVLCDEPERGYMEFEVRKKRMVFRVEKPYSEERKCKANWNLQESIDKKTAEE